MCHVVLVCGRASKHVHCAARMLFHGLKSSILDKRLEYRIKVMHCWVHVHTSKQSLTKTKALLQQHGQIVGVTT